MRLVHAFRGYLGGDIIFRYGIFMQQKYNFVIPIINKLFDFFKDVGECQYNKQCLDLQVLFGDWSKKGLWRLKICSKPLSRRKSRDRYCAVFNSAVADFTADHCWKISYEFGEPIFDLAVYDSRLIVREGLDEKLFTKYRILPIFRRHNQLYIATSNPTNIEAIDAIRFNSKLNIEVVIVEHDKLERLIEQNFTEDSTFDFDEDFDLEVGDNAPETQEDNDEPQGDEAPIVKYINKLLIDAIRMGASDLHFEPYEKATGSVTGLTAYCARLPILRYSWLHGSPHV